MLDIPFVKSSELQIARDMEEALFILPSDLILFVGVAVEPTIDTEPTFFVTAGCSRLIDPKICASAVYMELRKQWKTEKIDVKAFFGRVRDN